MTILTYLVTCLSGSQSLGLAPGEASIVNVRARPELSSFFKRVAGVRGTMATVRFLKMLIMMHCIFIRGR